MLMLNLSKLIIFYNLITIYCDKVQIIPKIAYIGIDTTSSMTDIKNEFMKLRKEYLNFCEKKVKILEPTFTEEVASTFSSCFEKGFENKLKRSVLKKSEIILNWPIDLIELIDNFTGLDIFEKEWPKIKQEKFEDVENIFANLQKKQSKPKASTEDLYAYYDIANNIIHRLEDELFIEITRMVCFYISSDYHLLNIIRFYNEGGRELNKNLKSNSAETKTSLEDNKNKIDIKSEVYNYDFRERAKFILNGLDEKLQISDFKLDLTKRKFATKFESYHNIKFFTEINLLSCKDLKVIIKEAFKKVQKTDKTPSYLLIELNLFNLQNNHKNREKNVIKKLDNFLNIIQKNNKKSKYESTKIIFIFYPEYDEYYANEVSTSSKLYHTIPQNLYENLVSKLNDFISKNEFIKYEKCESPLSYKGGYKDLDKVLNNIIKKVEV